jgi:DNA topoisomerase III
MKEGRIVPSRAISEVELISLMDRNGIGTDATIAQHILTSKYEQTASRMGNKDFIPQSYELHWWKATSLWDTNSIKET